MSDTSPSKRVTLVRDTVVFQLKLMADGFRDLLLLPVSLIATLIGLVRGGDEPDREFNQVIQVGRQSEQWINLFGTHDLSGNRNPAASIDALFNTVEEKLKQQYQAAGTSAKAQAEIDEALQLARDETTKQQPGE